MERGSFRATLLAGVQSPPWRAVSCRRAALARCQPKSVLLEHSPCPKCAVRVRRRILCRPADWRTDQFPAGRLPQGCFVHLPLHPSHPPDASRGSSPRAAVTTEAVRPSDLLPKEASWQRTAVSHRSRAVVSSLAWCVSMLQLTPSHGVHLLARPRLRHPKATARDGRERKRLHPPASLPRSTAVPTSPWAATPSPFAPPEGGRGLEACTVSRSGGRTRPRGGTALPDVLLDAPGLPLLEQSTSLPEGSVVETHPLAP